jgi:hypothetical protein
MDSSFVLEVIFVLYLSIFTQILYADNVFFFSKKIFVVSRQLRIRP